MKELCENLEEKLSLIENMYESIRIIDPINKNIINMRNSEIKDLKGKCYGNFNNSTIYSNCISIRANNENDIFNEIEERLTVNLNNSVINIYLLSIIMINIDNFKNVNEEYEQDIVKKILKEFSKLIDDLVVQNSYWIGRYSNDIFIIVLNNVDKEELYKILEQIRNLLEEISFEYNDKIIKLKANYSIYCAEDEITDVKNILKALEKSIFEEKQKRIDEEKNKEKKLSILNYRIQELRNVLNEMCISLDETVNYEQTLKVSQDLDELIVEYMKNII